MPSRISFAQNGEDIRLARVFGEGRVGTYVDVGANHPTEDSVSRYFYDRGWRGLAVEALPRLADAFRRSRPRDTVVNAFAGPAASSVPFFDFGAVSGLSTSDPQLAERHRQAGFVHQLVHVPTQSLSTLIDQAGIDVIDFMSVDVEGAESVVLKSLDMRRHRPKVMLVESILPHGDGARYAPFEEHLIDHGYTFVVFDGINSFYVAKEHIVWLPVLAAPLSVLDDYLPRRGLAELEHLRRELKRPLVRAASRVDRVSRRLLRRISGLKKMPFLNRFISREDEE